MIRFCLVLSVLSILFSSCDKRYWDWKKVRVYKKQGRTYHMEVRNASPALISSGFEEGIRKTCESELQKAGFVHGIRDTPNYYFVLQIQVDSIHLKDFRQAPLESIGGLHVLVQPRSLNDIPYESLVLELSLQYQIFLVKANKLYWENRNELYFFNRHKRDLRRSRSMARNALKDIP